MFCLGRPTRQRGLNRSRSAVLWGAALFLGSQLAVWLMLIYGLPQRDPEYDLRLQSLRALMAERPSSRPILFLGSSRIACTLRCDQLAVNQSKSNGPVVFNFGLCHSGPVMELLCLRRLLADGVRPRSLFIEVWPQAVLESASNQMNSIQPVRLRWNDLRILQPFHLAPPYGYAHWLETHAAPLWTYRGQMLDGATRSWFAPPRPNNPDWQGLDAWGWLAVPQMNTHDANLSRARADATAKVVVPMCNLFAPSEGSLLAYRELFALCRREKIEVGLLSMPDEFLADYSSAGRSRMDAFMTDLSRDNQLAMIDARTWSAPEDYFDGIHLTYEGAAVFTERFGQDVLLPFLSGEPLTARWPAGRLNSLPSGSSAATAAQTVQE